MSKLPGGRLLRKWRLRKKRMRWLLRDSSLYVRRVDLRNAKSRRMLAGIERLKQPEERAMSKIPDDYWSCYCVRRDAAGNMTHIKFNPPARRKCRKCGATQEGYLEVKRKLLEEEAERDA